MQQRLDSVFNQTYKNFEIILLDDASNDDSFKILEQYSNHPKVSHFIVNETNSGSPFKQWEKGIDLAKGEYIWIAESDDYCELNFLENLISKIKIDTVLIYSASMNIDEEGRILQRNVNQDVLDKRRWYSDFSNVGKKEVKKYLRFANTIPNASAAIFKKNLVREGYPYSSFKYCGDWFFWIDLLKKGSVEYSSKELNYFRTHSLTTRAPKGISKDAEMFTEFFRVIRSESGLIALILNKRKFLWLQNAIIKFEEIYIEQSFYENLIPNDQRIFSYWSKLEELESFSKRVKKMLLKNLK